MSISGLFVVGFIVSMFAAFIVVLGGVAWWSGQPDKAARVRTESSELPPESEILEDLAA